MSTLGILIFIVGLLLMILIHEAGHFFTAKAFKIKVEEFFVGFGPRLWSIKRGETEYGLKAIPAGGYVRIAGMNPYQEIAPEDRDRVFGAKAPWKRAIVLAAGSATHFILALLLLVSFFLFIGVPVFSGPTVVRVEPTLEGQTSPAVAAGLELGDEVLEADGRPIDTNLELIEMTRERVDREMILLVERDGREIEVRITPVLAEIEGEEAGRLGVVLTQEVVEERRAGPIESVRLGAEWTGRMTVDSFRALGQIFSPQGLGRIVGAVVGQEERALEDGAVGIVGAGRVAAQAAQAGALETLLFLFAGFNIIVGIINIMPLPPLDGGHLAVLAFEKVTGRSVDVRKLIPITALVAGFLILFTIALIYLDIASPVPDPFR